MILESFKFMRFGGKVMHSQWPQYRYVEPPKIDPNNFGVCVG